MDQPLDFMLSEATQKHRSLFANRAALTADIVPIAQLQFEEVNGPTAFDTSDFGQDNVGRLLSNARRAAGINGQAIQLSQPGDGIAIANSRDINLSIQRQRTVSFWFNGQDLAQDRPQVLYEEGGATRGLNAYVENGELVVGGWNRRESQWGGTWLKTDQISSNQWHHVAIVLDGTPQTRANAFTAYLDGQVIGSGNGSQLWKHTDGTGIGTVVGATRLQNGAMIDAASFTGKIDQVQIYNQALAAEAVTALATPPNSRPPLIPTGAQHSSNPTTVFVSDYGTPEEGRIAIQNAVRDPDAERVIIPDVGQPWIVDSTIFLDNGASADKEIILEAGTVVQAKSGSFLENDQPMFRIRSIDNVSFIGLGEGANRATIKMNAKEITQSEFGHILDFNGVTDYTIRGLRLTGAGGDGIHLAGASFVTPEPGKLNYSENGLIENIISENNRRQGISIDSAKDLIVRDSIFRDTEGTAPNAGIDVEPTWDFERIENVTIRDVELTDNNGSGLMFALGNLTDASTPVSATVENVWIENNNRSGIEFNQFQLDDDPANMPDGEINVRNVQILQSNGTWSNNTRTAGLNFRAIPGGDDDPENLKINIDQVSISETGHGEFSEGPIYFEGFGGSPALSEVGNVSLKNVVVNDAFDRPVIRSAVSVNRENQLSNIDGNVVAYNDNGVQVALDSPIAADGFDLIVRDGDRLSAPDLVDNGEFEAETNRWSVWNNSVSVVPRSASDDWVKIDAAGGGLGQSITDEIEAGQDYVIGGIGQLAEAGDEGFIGVLFRNAAGETFKQEVIPFKNSDRKLLRLGFTAPNRFAEAEVFAWKGEGSSNFFVDDISLQAQMGGDVVAR